MRGAHVIMRAGVRVGRALRGFRGMGCAPQGSTRQCLPPLHQAREAERITERPEVWTSRTQSRSRRSLASGLTLSTSHRLAPRLQAACSSSVVARPVVVAWPRSHGSPGWMTPPQRAHRICPPATRGASLFRKRPVRATVAACRRAATTTGALELLHLTPSARPACRDDLPVPTDTGGCGHLVVVLPCGVGGTILRGGSTRTPWVSPCEGTGFGEAERRTSSAARILTVCRAPPN